MVNAVDLKSIIYKMYGFKSHRVLANITLSLVVECHTFTVKTRVQFP